MSIALKLDLSEAQQYVGRVNQFGATLSASTIRDVIGRAVQQLIKAHFIDLANDSAHHRSAESLGAERTGFYEKAATSTQNPVSESDGVSISINQEGIAQRLFGGDIEPVTAQFLAIPARTESYGKRPREFDNLRFILFPSGAGALVARDATVVRGGKRGGRNIAGLAGRHKGDALGGEVYFWLVKHVTQRPDPTVLPSDEEMLEAAATAAAQYLDAMFPKT